MNAVQEKNERGSRISPRTEARHQALREALIGAAERRIAESGLDGLKARELAQEAGCALGALYNVFEDLDALVLAVNARTLEALESGVSVVPGDGDAVARVQALADAYVGYAAAHRSRWAALFDHRMAGGRPLPGWYAALLARLFAHVEEPLAALRPGMEAAERASLARSLFSAVHGVVALGLDEKLGPMPDAQLRGHVRLLSGALARGLLG